VLSRLRVREIMMTIAVVSLGLLGFGLYLQHVVGLEPCPMCIVQRYALSLIVFMAALLAVLSHKLIHLVGTGLVMMMAGFGAFVAARQSWLQWYPPEVASCGRDFYGMIEMFPLQRAIPMIFKGSGDCAKVDWTFLGGSIANWSFAWFCAIALVAFALLWTQLSRRAK